MAEPITEMQVDVMRIPRFPYCVVHRDPRTQKVAPVATFAYRSHAGALICQIEATNPDARDQFQIQLIAY